LGGRPGGAHELRCGGRGAARVADRVQRLTRLPVVHRSQAPESGHAVAPTAAVGGWWVGY
jgi:hypothetical protein